MRWWLTPRGARFRTRRTGGAAGPRGLLLQWHVTQRCNLRCAHCYQETYAGEELCLDDLLRVLEQFKDLLERKRREANGRTVRGHITVTGGEPFVRQDFLDLLDVFSANRALFSFAILTNGTFIDQDTLIVVEKIEENKIIVKQK